MGDLIFPIAMLKALELAKLKGPRYLAVGTSCHDWKWPTSKGKL